MTRILIVNADDYARTAAVSQGIRYAHKNGIVTSTTVMMNLQEVKNQVTAAFSETPELGIGVHLNLTYGSPSAGDTVPTLIDERGKFHPRDRWFDPHLQYNREEVALEWQAQIDAALELGVQIDHLDSHHHIAAFREDLWHIYLELARKYHCCVRPPFPTDLSLNELTSIYPRRQLEFARIAADELASQAEIRHPDSFLASFFGRTATLEHLKELIIGLGEGVSEIMCHPGHTSHELTNSSGYAREREIELSILSHPDIASLIQSKGIQLRTYRTAWD